MHIFLPFAEVHDHRSVGLQRSILRALTSDGDGENSINLVQLVSVVSGHF